MDNNEVDNALPLLATPPSSLTLSAQKRSSLHIFRHALFLLTRSCNTSSIIICILISSLLQIACAYLSFKSQLLLSGVVGAVLDGKQSDAVAIVVNAGAFYAALASLQVIGAFFSEHVRLGARVRLGLFLHASYFGASGRPYRMMFHQDRSSSSPRTSSTPILLLDNVDLRITQDVDQLTAQVCGLFLGSYAMPSSALGTIASLIITFSALLSPERSSSGGGSRSGEDLSSLPLPALLLALLLFAVSALVSHFLATRVARAFYISDSSIGTLRFAYARIRQFFEEISLLNGQDGEEKKVKSLLEDAIRKTRWLSLWQFAQSSFSSFSAQVPYLLAYAVGILSLPLYLDAEGGVDVSAVSAAVSISGQFIASIGALPHLWGQIATLSGYLSRVSDLVDALDRDTDEKKKGLREEEGGGRDMNDSQEDVSDITREGKQGPPIIIHFDSSSSSFSSSSTSHSLLTPPTIIGGAQIRVPLQTGQSVRIMGPSGSGKTSSLRLLAGLERLGGRLGDALISSKYDAVFIPQRSYFPSGTLYDGIVACSTTFSSIDNTSIKKRGDSFERVINVLDDVLIASETTSNSRVEVLNLLRKLEISPSSPSSTTLTSLFIWMLNFISLIRNPTLLGVSVLSQNNTSFIPSSSLSYLQEELIPSREEVVSCLEELGLMRLLEGRLRESIVKVRDDNLNMHGHDIINEDRFTEEETISCDWMRILSAGELQLLLLASSVLLRYSRSTTTSSSSSSSLFVFLDEATSALDAITREKVMKALDKRGVTIISFSHHEKGYGNERGDEDESVNLSHDKRFSQTIRIPVHDELKTSPTSSSSLLSLSEEKRAFQDASYIYLERGEEEHQLIRKKTSREEFSPTSLPSSSSDDLTPLSVCIFTVFKALSPTQRGIYKGLSSLSSSLSFLFSSSQRNKSRLSSAQVSLFSPKNDAGFILILIGVLLTSISLSIVSLQVAFIPGAIFDAIIEGNTSLAWNWFFYAFIVYISSALLGAFSRTLGKFVALSSFYRLVHYVQRLYLQPGMPPLVQLVSDDVIQGDHSLKSSSSSSLPLPHVTPMNRSAQSIKQVGPPPLWALHSHTTTKTSVSSSSINNESFNASSSPSSTSTEKHKIDSLDQRLISDTHSLTTSLCTVFFGGDNKLSLIQVLSTVIATSATTSARFGSTPVLICFMFAALSVIISAVSSLHLPRAIALVAQIEGLLRSTHARVRTFAEEIGFLRLERSEQERADALLMSVAAVGVNAILIELPPRIINNVFALCGTAVAYGIVCYSTTVNDASSLFGLVSLLSTLILYLTSFPSYYTSCIEACGYIRRVSALLVSVEQVSYSDGDGDGGGDDEDERVASSYVSGDTTDVTSIDIGPLNLPHLRWKSSSPSSSSSLSSSTPLQFSLQRGGLICITGASACGKTTLIRTLLGLESSSNTSIASPLIITAHKGIRGESLSSHQHHQQLQIDVQTRLRLLTAVPQRAYILPFGSSLADNIVYPVVVESWEEEREKSSENNTRMKVLDALTSAGLTYLLDRHSNNQALFSIIIEKRGNSSTDDIDDESIDSSSSTTARQHAVTFTRSVIDWSRTLSGGERQRVAIARLLFKRPAFAVLDEAFNALPHSEGQHLLNVLREKNIGVILMSSST